LWLRVPLKRTPDVNQTPSERRVRQEREPPDTTNYTNLYVKNFPADWDEAPAGARKRADAYGTPGQRGKTCLRCSCFTRCACIIGLIIPSTGAPCRRVRRGERGVLPLEKGPSGPPCPRPCPYYVSVSVSAMSTPMSTMSVRCSFGTPGCPQMSVPCVCSEARM